MKKFLKSESELNELIEYVKSMLTDKSKIVLLRGDLASGKSTFVKGFVKSLGVNDSVTSPTFTKMQQYGENIYHYDMYNHGISDFLALGLGENLDSEGYHLIEWADEVMERMLRDFMFDFVIVEIELKGDIREYTIRGADES